MSKYQVIVSKHVANNLLEHMTFISNVSIEAAQRFVEEYEAVINALEENPLKYQVDTTFDNTYEYRRVIFAKWYKCVFAVEESTVYIDSVVDCRQDNPQL